MHVLFLLFFLRLSSEKNAGPPGAQPHHPIATFQRYRLALHAAQAQIDLRGLEIEGLTVRPLRTSVAPVKVKAAAEPFKIQAVPGPSGNMIYTPVPRGSLAAAWLAKGEAVPAVVGPGGVPVPAAAASGSAVPVPAAAASGSAVPVPAAAASGSAVPVPAADSGSAGSCSVSFRGLPVPGGVRAVPPPSVMQQPVMMQGPVQRPPASIGVPAAPPANMAGSHGMPCGGFPVPAGVVPGPPPPFPPPFPVRAVRVLQPMPLQPPADWLGACGGYVPAASWLSEGLAAASSNAVSQLPKFLLWFLLLFLLSF